MVGITLSPEQIRAAPPEVRRWLEHEIASTFGFEPSGAAAHQAPTHLVGASLEEARAILAMIQRFLPVVTVFFELGREPAATPAPGVRAYRLADILRHARLGALEQVLASLEMINEAARNIREDADAVLAATDAHGVCFVAEATSANVLRLWQEIAGGAELTTPAAPGAAYQPPPFAAPVQPVAPGYGESAQPGSAPRPAAESSGLG